MGIWDRIKFIARSNLNSIADGDLGKKAKKAIDGLFEGDAEPDPDDPASPEYADISMEELERRFQAEFGDLGAGGPKPGAGRRPGPRAPKPAVLDAHYKTLELAPGAPFETVQAQFKKLMKKYHPDRYAADAKKQAWATKMSQTVTEAFSAIEKARKDP